MSGGPVRLVVLSFILLVTTAVVARADSLDALRTQIDAGQYRAAVPLAEALLAEVGDRDDARALAARHAAGVLYTELGRHDEADAFLSDVLATREARLGAEHPLVADAYAALSYLRVEMEQYDESETLIQRALAIRERLFGPGSRQVGETLSQYGEVAAFAGDFDTADDLMTRAVDGLEAVPTMDGGAALGEALVRLGHLRSAQERNAEALSLAQQGYTILLRALGPRHPEVADALFVLGTSASALELAAEAEDYFRRGLAIDEVQRGASHAYVSITLGELAALYLDQERYSEAKAAYERALAIDERNLGPDHEYVGYGVQNLAEAHRLLGEVDVAIELLTRAIAIERAVHAPEDDASVGALDDLVALYLDEDRLEEAEAWLVRTLDARERAGAPIGPLLPLFRDLADAHADAKRHADTERVLRHALARAPAAIDRWETAETQYDLANLYLTLGRFDEANAVTTEALRLADGFSEDEEMNGGKIHALHAAVLIGLGRMSDAEASAQRALVLLDPESALDIPLRSAAYNLLGTIKERQGRLAEAEPYFRAALSTVETYAGSDDLVVGALTDLARFYGITLGRVETAEALIERALTLAGEVYGEDHTRFADLLTQVAQVRIVQGRLDEAEDLMKRAVASREALHGTSHVLFATTLRSLGDFYRQTGSYDLAERHLTRARAIGLENFGPDHLWMSDTAMMLAMTHLSQGRPADAETAIAEALRARERLFGPDHVENFAPSTIAAVIAHLAEDGETALRHIRRATELLRLHAESRIGKSVSGDAVQYSAVPDVVLVHLTLLGTLPADEAAAEAFDVVQLAHRSGAASALTRMAERFGAGDDDRARLMRERQDVIERRKTLDVRLLDAVSRAAADRRHDDEARIKRQLGALDARRSAIDAELVERFPEFAELAAPPPLLLAEAQELLDADEALVVFLVREGGSAVIALTPDGAALHGLDLDAEAVAAAVETLRSGLDPTRIGGADDLLRFPVDRAHRLYQELFAPIEALLGDARHVMVVPDGALESLPLGVLLTAAPPAAIGDLGTFRELPWLARRHALSVLPAVSSLRALRRGPERPPRGETFLGIGDPLLSDHPGALRTGDAAAGPAHLDSWLAAASASLREADLRGIYIAGGEASVDTLKSLASLPETAGELAMMAGALNAGADDLLLREAASEPGVRARLSSGHHRIIAFATHALVAGELNGVVEPALVLTPPDGSPEGPDPANDGLLSSSEIAALALDAEWVILSACNTAASDGSPDAGGLSGLARSFFHAGSRALFVSHWPVLSEATVRLTTGMFGALAADPTLGRAEAHRRAMLALMNDPDSDLLAHPAIWAPFVIVGEGGRPAALRRGEP